MQGSKAHDREVRIGWKMAGLGFEVATGVMAGAGLGWLFDRWKGTAPTGLLVGAIAGICIGMLTLIRGALRLNRALEATSPRRKRVPPSEADDDSEVDEWDRRWNDKWDDRDRDQDDA